MYLLLSKNFKFNHIVTKLEPIPSFVISLLFKLNIYLMCSVPYGDFHTETTISRVGDGFRSSTRLLKKYLLNESNYLLVVGIQRYISFKLT